MSGSVAALAAEAFDWLRPAALRGARPANPAGWELLFRPAILEFATDDFLAAFLADLAAADRGAPAALAAREVALDGIVPKLFQPLHGRYYLAVAALACRRPGFPDRCVLRACDETVFVVQRRRRDRVEYGWVPEGEKRGWLPVSAGKLLDGEERYPMMAAPSSGPGRAVWFAYLPVASLETFEAPPELSPIPDHPLPDEREEDFGLAVTRPLTELLAAPANTVPAAEVSFFLLHDLGHFLADSAKKVFGRLEGTVADRDLNPAQLAVVAYLEGISVGGKKLAHWTVLAGKSDYPQTYQPGTPLPFSLDLRDAAGLDAAKAHALVFAADVLNSPSPPPSGSNSARRVGKFAPRDPTRPDDDTYLLRCVYERPRCDPVQRWISRLAGPYRLAEAMDPDAPARPVRISLPADVSIAGLRKFQKGVGFAMSKALRNKLAGISGRESDLLDGKKPGSDGSFSLGHICSFALPIITLCAFILLMIIAVLLNIVFWWLPFLKICFPLRSSR